METTKEAPAWGPYPCPDPDCLVWPYAREDEVQEHVESGRHVYEIGVPAGDPRTRGDSIDAPDREAAPAGEGRGGMSGPSPKQAAFIRRLVEERARGDAELDQLLRLVADSVDVDGASVVADQGLDRFLASLTVKQASSAIDALKWMPVRDGGELVGRWRKVGDQWLVVLPVDAVTGDEVTVRSRKGDKRVHLGVVHDVDGPDAFWTVDRDAPVDSGKVDDGAERRKDRRRSAPEPDEGFYVVGDAVFKVQESQTGRRYAKRLADAGRTGRLDWEYVGREPFAAIADEGRPLTAEKAAYLGRLTGRCVFCSRKLTDERSIDVGYGPDCAAKHCLPWGALHSKGGLHKKSVGCTRIPGGR